MFGSPPADFHSHNKANKIEKMSSTFRQKEIDMFSVVEAFWKYNHKVVVCAETESSCTLSLHNGQAETFRLKAADGERKNEKVKTWRRQAVTEVNITSFLQWPCKNSGSEEAVPEKVNQLQFS